VAARLVKDGFEVRVERGAGEGAFQADQAYADAGAALVDRAGAFAADLVAVVNAPAEPDYPLLAPGRVVVGFLRPLDDPDGMTRLAATGVTALAMELVPRITRAQKMDALSAMGTVAGYRAVLLAAGALPRFFPLLTTAAGTIRPAKVFVLGAGVAGLQAIATAKRLGAVVAAYDVRAAAAEQVKSVGARFVELELDTAGAEGEGGYAKAMDADRQRRQTELLIPHVGEADVVIPTALIPGKRAPLLITEAAVKAMQPGSVIVDVAAPNGGNCELTRPGETVVAHGVTIMAPLDLASAMATHASAMYARTLAALIGEFTGGGTLATDFEDEIFSNVCVTHGGAVVHPRLRPAPAA
jgi:H+-translocating NAD(P) transhydrogenase subunit alpha